MSTEPPTVVLFVNHPSLFDTTYQRYLMNVFREKLPFRDIPAKLYLRARSQTALNSRAGPLDLTADEGPLVSPSSRSTPAPRPNARSVPEVEVSPDDSGSHDHRVLLDMEVNDMLADLDE